MEIYYHPPPLYAIVVFHSYFRCVNDGGQYQRGRGMEIYYHPPPYMPLWCFILISGVLTTEDSIREAVVWRYITTPPPLYAIVMFHSYFRCVDDGGQYQRGRGMGYITQPPPPPLCHCDVQFWFQVCWRRRTVSERPWYGDILPPPPPYMPLWCFILISGVLTTEDSIREAVGMGYITQPPPPPPYMPL